MADDPRARLREMLTIRVPEGGFIPHNPTIRQRVALCVSRREILYGGAAGGGKSDWLLMGALQYVDVPGYSALLLRRTFQQLSLEGALIPRSHEWLGGTAARWNGEKRQWRFPSGAVLQFGHLEHEKDKYNYQSAEFQFVGFDELTQFTRSQYTYLFSRLRRLKASKVPLRAWSASNPGGGGHDWVKDRFMVERKPTRYFVPAALKDNPHLDRAEYVSALAELDPVTRRQLLDGDWDVRPSGALFKREWFTIVDAAPANARSVRGWDFAATLPKPGTDPDWTVGVKVSEADGIYYIEDVKRDRLTSRGVEALFVQTCALDGSGTTQWIEQEPGSSGKMASEALIRAARGYTVRAERSTGSKAERAAPFASQAEAGNVRLVRGPWNAAYLDELEAFAPDCSHDDQVDGSSLGFAKLHKRGVSWDDLYPEAAA
jgi:predicted phage terminase large subunit-like protein